MSEEPLPIGRNFSAADLEQGFQKLEISVPDQPFLAHRYLAPKDCPLDRDLLAQPIVLSTSTPAAVSVCRNEGEAVYLQVQAVTPPREIAAAHWLQAWAGATGRTIHLINAISPLFADSLVTFEIEGHAFMGRAAVRGHGDVLFLLFAFCPAGEYPKWADKLGLFISSFRPTGPMQHPAIEPRQKCACGPVKFELPASWRVKPSTDRDGGARLDALNLDDEESLNGWLQARYFPKAEATTRIDVIEATQATWREAGFQVGELLEGADQEAPKELAKSAHLKVYSLKPPNPNSPEHEGWVLVLALEKGHLAVALLTPSQHAAELFYVWAFNRRAFGIATEAISC